MRVGLLTDRAHPSLTHDDRRSLPAFARRGIVASPVVWTDPDVDWTSWDAIVVRSPWDYVERFDEFAAVLDALEALGTRLVNPLPVLRWNLRKSYLDELDQRGVRVIPTERHAGVMGSLAAHVARWGRIVVKPEVSAAGKRTYRVDAGTLDEIDRRLAAWPADVFLVQPYLKAVETTGELSLVFFDRVYSHAIVKRAAHGSFLVHEEHGGTIRRAQPPESVIAEARAVLDHVEGALPYARVDMIVDESKAYLVELELVEPELFLRFDRSAPSRFVSAVLAHVGGP